MGGRAPQGPSYDTFREAMISSVHELEAAVLALPVQERERLARRLLSSLDVEEQEVRDAWVIEVRERLARYRAGEIEALPVEHVMREARKIARAP